MTGFFMFLHAIVCVFLVAIILMQSGRGGGLTEAFSGAESMFGAQTNEFMIKATTVFATFFLVTCLGLAVVSAKKDKSLMSGTEVTKEVEKNDGIFDETIKKAATETNEATTEIKEAVINTTEAVKEVVPADNAPNIPAETVK
ncbi:hypothetical protein MNBD_UNCLBAC01-1411 [hydrothermal vent metagenome]|uniref:Protein translocase membrane subunit SecG n=1 Tax=hydrothermal vent metagenome TaxID=652676 RepID=A0A3B1DK74_9ZZZZ